MRKREWQSVRKQIRSFVEEFREELGRKERRHWCGMYLSGLMLDGERKSIEPMAARLPGGDEQALQQFVNQSPWEHEPVQEHLIHTMLDRLKLKEGILVLDDTTFPKKGRHSVGVAHQYCGALGKVANCQAMVSWHYAGVDVHFPLLGELYLPKAWIQDRGRLKKAGVPFRRKRFQEKWKMALSLLDRIANHVVHKALVFDAGYGEIRPFLRELDQREEHFIAQIPQSHSFWPLGIPLQTKRKQKGRPRQYPAMASKKIKARSAKKWKAHLLAKGTRWKKIRLPLKTSKTVEVLATRVYEVTPGAYYRPGPERWLIIERLPCGEIRYYVSNFPPNASLTKMVRWAHQRWNVEQGYQQLKEELGMDHFEGRSWRGFHHHITLCFMAYDFLRLLQDRYGKKNFLSPSRKFEPGFKPSFP